MTKLHKIIATGLGTGYVPIAPGTAGSVLGIILLFGFNKWLEYSGYTLDEMALINLVVIVLVLLIGVYAIKNIHKIWQHDASKIVIDEIVGVWIAALFIPIKWQYYLYALLLFRFFDIVKPFFIRKLDDKSSDWSVMLDDVLAGIYSLVVIQVLYHFELI